MRAVLLYARIESIAQFIYSIESLPLRCRVVASVRMWEFFKMKFNFVVSDQIALS